MNVKPIEIRWHPGISIYASGQFLKTVGDDFGWLGGFDDSENLRCVLPYTIVRKASVRMVRFRVETIPWNADLSIEEEKDFLNRVVAYFRSVHADLVIPATTNSIFRTYPRGAVAAPYGTLIIDLNQSEETLFGNLSPSHRRKVRLAIKAGVEITDGPEHAGTAYALVRETFERSSIRFMNSAAFHRMVGGLGEYVKILVARHRGVIQGALVIPYSTYGAYYNYGGSIPEPETGAMVLLHWQAIRMFRDLGVQRYDFCGVRINPDKGSKQDGLLSFKERFGPRLFQGYMWKCNINPIKSRVYSLAVRFLKGGDIVDAERHKITTDLQLDPSAGEGHHSQ